MDRDTLDLYVLGALDDAETARVEAYLLAHPDVLREVRAEREALAQAALVQAAPVPAGAEERLLARLRAQPGVTTPDPIRPPATVPAARPAAPRARAPRRSAPWGAVLLAVAAVGVGIVVLPGVRDWSAAQTYASARRTPGAQSEVLLGASGTRVGELTRMPDGRILVLMDRAPTQDHSYQAWRIEGTQVTSLGVFDGRLFATDDRVQGRATFGLTVEPRGGRPTPTLPPLSTTTLS
ncbi:anti-sigma factor domain-containing protein [Deinococcus maricopensis]|uniref:anti-sigma factor n=1 Tax=Deinococcus maricopensis TaxID=309887 RepID=UPI00145E5414|nr:anti-sigma factor [Deinococcus maricopensis]